MNTSEIVAAEIASLSAEETCLFATIGVLALRHMYLADDAGMRSEPEIAQVCEALDALGWDVSCKEVC